MQAALVVHPYLGVRPTSLVQRRSTSALVLLHPCTLARPTTSSLTRLRLHFHLASVAQLDKVHGRSACHAECQSGDAHLRLLAHLMPLRAIERLRHPGLQWHYRQGPTAVGSAHVAEWGSQT